MLLRSSHAVVLLPLLQLQIPLPRLLRRHILLRRRGCLSSFLCGCLSSFLFAPVIALLVGFVGGFSSGFFLLDLLCRDRAGGNLLVVTWAARTTRAATTRAATTGAATAGAAAGAPTWAFAGAATGAAVSNRHQMMLMLLLGVLLLLLIMMSLQLQLLMLSQLLLLMLLSQLLS